MPLELTARTDAGARLITLAESLAEDLAVRAPIHDREGTYPHASVDALRDAGYFTAPIPEAHGGLGVTSVHDVIVAASRLARGDASVAIGVNMHMTALLNVVRRWQMATASGDGRRAGAFASWMRAIARDGVIMAAAISEPGQDLTRPATTARRVPEGWRVDGRKSFCSMSPAATDLYTSVTFTDDEGTERYGYALIATDAPGVTVHDDWDALGMRASGSHSVTFDGVVLPASALRGGFPTGGVVAFMERSLTAGLFHASASLGIAEAAQENALRGVTRRGQDGARIRALAAESAIELAACRAALSRAGMLIDDHQEAYPASQGPDEELAALFAETQAVKTFVNESAARLVDRALALVGGAGFSNRHPVARACRDVRAAAFMNPLGSDRAHELLGSLALGHAPALG
jgi:alkylation response protein AidB-like acyl-CoA dehydrogenase